LNELVSSHKAASNVVMNAEEKIAELSKEYIELAEQIKDVEEEIIMDQFHKTGVSKQ
jgi:hypothetical protein